MEVFGVAPLEVGSLVSRDAGLEHRLTVVCKATYRLLPGESKLAPDQDPLCLDEEPRAGEPARAPCDLVPRKARADVTLVGHAFAPRGEAVRSLVARLVVGAVDKEIEIFSDRAWTREGVLRDGARFTRMPLSWDRAAGGPGTSNPLGVRTGAAAQPDAQGAVILPNLQPVGGAPGSRLEPIQPVGFGPVPASFPERLARLGRYAGGWTGALALDAPLPDDLDLGYFNAAPSDQQVPLLRDGERLILQNLHRDHPRLMTALPAARPRAFAERSGAPPREVGLRCDTLWIDTDRAICTLTWRGQLPLASRDEPGRVICALEEPGMRLAYADILALAGPPPAPPRIAPIVPTALSAPAVIEPPPAIELAPEEDRPTTPAFRVPEPTPGMDLVADPPVAPKPRSGRGVFATARISVFAPSEALPFQGRPAGPSAPPAVEPPALRGLPRAQTLVTVPSTSTSSGPAWLSAPVPSEHGSAPAAPRFGEPPPRARDSARPPAGELRGRLPSPSTVVAPLPAAPRVERGPSAGRDAIELLWADPSAAPRIRRAFGDLMGDLPPPSPLDPAELRAERHEAAVMRALSAAGRCDAAGLEDAMAGAVGPDARFHPPVVLIAGELRFTFDDVEVRRAWATAREALAESRRAPSEEILGAEVERLLLGRRAYRRCALLGAPRIHALVTLPGAEEAFPVYLPEALATVVPMFPAFDARILALAHPSHDQSEAHEIALEALALGRVLLAVSRRW